MSNGSAVRTAWASDMILGEGTLYSMRENALYWVDIKRPAIHRLDFASAHVVSIPCPTTWAGWSSAPAEGSLPACAGALPVCDSIR